MSIEVSHGSPSAAKSIAQLVEPKTDAVFESDIDAGTTVRWQIYPKDENDNKIVIDLSKEALKQSLFSYKQFIDNVEEESSEAALVSSDSAYYYVDLALTKEGKYTFKAFYDNEEVDTQVDMVTVLPLAPSFANSRVQHFNDQLQQFQNCNGSEFF